MANLIRRVEALEVGQLDRDKVIWFLVYYGDDKSPTERYQFGTPIHEYWNPATKEWQNEQPKKAD